MLLRRPMLASIGAPGIRSPTWTPADFASVTLVGYYDAEDNTKLTDAGSGACSDWVDSANGANTVTQGTGASRPTIVAAHALTGRQVLQFDSTDDYMSLLPCPYATTGNLSMIVVGVQDALVADTTDRYPVCNGNSVNNGLMMRRIVTAGANRWQVRTSTVNHNTAATAATALDGRFVGIGTWASTTQSAMINGVGPSTPTAATMGGDVTRFRIGALHALTPVGFWNGAISAILIVTGAISAQDLNNLHIWAAGRLGLR